MTSSTIPAVRHTVAVNASAGPAFEVFASAMATWFPYRIGEAEIAEIVVEPRVGGRWYERGMDVVEYEWGRVLAYEPAHRLRLAWHLTGRWTFQPDPAQASEIEVTFTEEGPGRTRVALDHRDFERHGEAGPRIRETVAGGAGAGGPGGWEAILATYAKTAEARTAP